MKYARVVKKLSNSTFGKSVVGKIVKIEKNESMPGYYGYFIDGRRIKLHRSFFTYIPDEEAFLWRLQN